MKKIFPILLAFLFFAYPAFSATWCKWDGSAGVDCRNDRNGIVRLDNGYGVTGTANINLFDFYERVTTQPTLGADQVKDAETWSFDGTQITRTWTVRDLTTEEIQTRDDLIAAETGMISREIYYVLKWLIAEEVISSTNISNAPAALRAAYQARGRLEAE